MRHPIDLDALSDLFVHRVAAVAELIHLGMSGAFLAGRCRPGGPWQRLLPGILLLGKAPPTRPQLIQAALRYAGPQAMVTGLDALQLHGMRSLPATGPVHVLVPVRYGVKSSGRAHVERTGRYPDPVLRRGFLTAPAARAAVDAARRLRTLGDVRAVLTEVARFVGPGDLRAELEEASPRGCALARQVITGGTGRAS